MDEIKWEPDEDSKEMLIKIEDLNKSECDNNLYVKENSSVDALNNLYAGHEVKDEMVIGPEVLQSTSLQCGDALTPKKCKLEAKIENIQAKPKSDKVDENAITAAETTTVIVDTANVTTNEASGNDFNITCVDSNRCICNDCGRVFKTKRALIQHIALHSKLKHAICFYCDLCTYEAVSRACLEKHMEKKHDMIDTGDGFFKCAACDYKSTCKSNLQDHLLSHSGEKPYRCTACKYRTTQKSHLNRHLMTHAADKPYSCTTCKYKCNQKTSLNRHLLTHTGEKPYNCTICNYKCSRKDDMRKHLLTHTGEKPYRCTICNYECSAKSNLRQHLLVHTGVKPYSCSVCDYRYSRKSSMKRHMLTHTGEKPYSCTVCNYKCSRKSTLKEHLLTHTGRKPYACKVCNFKSNRKKIFEDHLLCHTDEKSQAVSM